jgi:hypothetical protein
MRVSRISWASRSVTTPALTADASMAAADSSTPGAAEAASVSWRAWRLHDRWLVAAAAEPTGGQCQQPAGDEPRVFGRVVAGDGLVEGIHHDSERLLAIERRRVTGDAMSQTRQQAGGHDTERARVGMGRADERAEELILAVPRTRTERTAQVPICEPGEGRFPPDPGVPLGPRRRGALERGLQV